MPDQAKTKNLEIERLRGVAVIMTAIAHGSFSDLLPPYLTQTFTGVDIFFVISGFVVTLSLLRLLPDLKEDSSFEEKLEKSKQALSIFYLKRAFRILPMAIFWMFSYWCLSMLFKNTIASDFSKPEYIFMEAIGILSGFYNYMVSYGLSGNLSQYWSLCVEEQFYITLPILFLIATNLKNRKKMLLRILLFLTLVVPAGSYLLKSTVLKYVFAERYFAIVFGVLLALFTLKATKAEKPDTKPNYFEFSLINKLSRVINNPKIIRWIVTILEGTSKFLVSLTLLAVIWITPSLTQDNYRYYLNYIVVAVFATVLVFLASKEKGWVLNMKGLRRVLEYVGARSYVIYLSHFLFIRLRAALFYIYNPLVAKFYDNFLPYPATVHLFFQHSFAWVMIIIAAELCYRFMEKPMIDLGAKYIKYTYKV
ncbi:hypothetical protein A3K34_01820 [candidate division WWE3 bacterium RIFOXYC1_FULL_40_10]|uniref:Acyltransferase 3 domain-containing protein n=1 Tax=candidate division WWE3 bacterium RIFOXYA2_FULL_46_9 TaxID=1802636 RepID=A0A1F4W2Z8_UNCKA|nr:MAG: hypothetical protein A3K58_01820 [candidate division WWE3 bacterium RIFOXYB1_FULL_40_22]OGC61601.1 MAG: hypothetical protein A3K37_01820 [candidate division WWE3 bacterium RIFOXYA1_FULL_40_11]OGC63648.1 MAG: hypothetical protein A2264_04765 [candidate division WWE3 bacterium RIFOXYA2_FULL_46_9]OGC64721.1 MAG: hypothetical protein A2326_01630 [candidate division WWE3 bacterium RIFOXYB2_FULL_41_6]OGC65984.1 MAG: hypothetical protein A3K34_01820 [candidate division WWE3 bacterium RIFOXYC1_